ncbi:MAG: ribonuclease HI [Treponema sp.]|nr:ribonuclease HI [Treponema sp.]
METALGIYTDGGCSGNPGPGGWAYVILLETFAGVKIIAQDQGGEKDTTNNRMELTAVIESLRAIKKMNDLPRGVCVYTDSQYVQKGISEWIFNWKRNSWKTASKKPVKNKDLWMELDLLSGEFSVSWKWVKGHDGNEYNEMCDKMTQEAIAGL